MKLIQEEVAPNRYHHCSPKWALLYLENKKKFRDWVSVDADLDRFI